MIDIWVKFVSDQFEIALNMTRALFGLGAMEAPVPVHKDQAEAVAPDRADAVAANPMDEPQKTGREEERFAAVVPEAEDPGQAAPVSGSVAGEVPERPIEGHAGSARSEAAVIEGIISFLESADRGATVREVAEHLEMDKRNILPLLKTLVKEGRIDELLGRYCVLN